MNSCPFKTITRVNVFKPTHTHSRSRASNEQKYKSWLLDYFWLVKNWIGMFRSLYNVHRMRIKIDFYELCKITTWQKFAKMLLKVTSFSLFSWAYVSLLETKIWTHDIRVSGPIPRPFHHEIDLVKAFSILMLNVGIEQTASGIFSIVLTSIANLYVGSLVVQKAGSWLSGSRVRILSFQVFCCRGTRKENWKRKMSLSWAAWI